MKESVREEQCCVIGLEPGAADGVSEWMSIGRYINNAERSVSSISFFASESCAVFWGPHCVHWDGQMQQGISAISLVWGEGLGVMLAGGG